MRIHRDTPYLEDADRGASAAIGNFDGVHLGHQAILKIAAQSADAPLGVVTFEPHPREYFVPDSPPFRLMNAEAKAHRLEMLGVQHLYELAFNEKLAALTPEAFCRDIIVDRLGLTHVTIGSDFCFGVTIADLVETDGVHVSSTRIRQALSDGRPEEAAAMLGHLHRIEGEVVRGYQRGRELGYPTANMMITGLHPPKFGVYAVRVEVRDGDHKGMYDGVASLGIRPMFDGDVPNLETFLFDFAGDLYGTHLSVALVRYLRPEAKFDGLDALITQMDADSAEARRILAT